MNPHTRLEFVKSVKKLLRTHNISFGEDEENLLQRYFNQERHVKDKIRGKFMLKSNTALENASIALCQSQHRVPVLVDPSDTAIRWLHTWLPNSSFASVLNQDAASISNFVRGAMQEGRTIVLHDVEDIHLIPEPMKFRTEDAELIALLKSLLERDIVTQSELQFFKSHKGEEWDFNDSFRLFILCSTARPEFSSKACALSVCINFGVEKSECSRLLQESAMSVLRNARYDLLRSANSDLVLVSNHVEDAQQVSKDRFVEASLKDDCAVVEAIRARDKFLELESQMKDAKELDCDMRKELEEFVELGSRVALIRSLANRLESSMKTCRGNGVDMTGFKYTFERVLCDVQDDWSCEDKRQDAEKKVLQRCFEFCARRLRESDRNALAVMLSLHLCGVDGNLINVFFDIRGDLENVEEECPYKWLSQEDWSALNRLERSCVFFEELTENLCEHEGSWRLYYESERPEELKLPAPYDKITHDTQDMSTRFYRIMLLHALRQDRTVESLRPLMRVQDLILTFSFEEERDVKEEQEEKIESEKTNMFATAHNATLILMQDSSSMEPSTLIEEISKQKGVSSKLLSVCGDTQNELSALRSWSSTNKVTQRCLILQNAHLNTELLLEAERILRESKNALREKHLWILLDEKEADEIRVPRRLYSVCNVLVSTSSNYSLFSGPSRTVSVLNRALLFQNCVASSPTKYVQTACLLQAKIAERAKHSFLSFGWTSPEFKVRHDDMMTSLEILNKVSSQKSLLNLLLETVAFGTVSTEQDRSTLRYLIEQVNSEEETASSSCSIELSDNIAASRALLSALGGMICRRESRDRIDDEKENGEDELKNRRVLEDLKHYVRDVICKYEDSLLNSSFWSLPHHRSSTMKMFGSKPLEFVFLKEKRALANIVEIVRRDLLHVIDVVDSEVIENESYTKMLFEKILLGHVPKSWLDSGRITDLRSLLDMLHDRKRQLELWYVVYIRAREARKNHIFFTLKLSTVSLNASPHFFM